MSYVEKLIEFLEGGDRGDLFDIISGEVCEGCKSGDSDCDRCGGHKIITTVENLIAKSGLDFIKEQARQWVEISILKGGKHGRQGS